MNGANGGKGTLRMACSIGGVDYHCVFQASSSFLRIAGVLLNELWT